MTRGEHVLENDAASNYSLARKRTSLLLRLAEVVLPAPAPLVEGGREKRRILTRKLWGWCTVA